MGKKKSLGSSPIGYSALNDHSYSFIRDLGVSPNQEEEEKRKENEQDYSYSPASPNGNQENRPAESETAPVEQTTNDPNEKKIVSYYLEIQLIERLKSMADDRNIFYSTLVSEAVEIWLEANGY